MTVIKHDGWRVLVLGHNGTVCGAGVLIAADLVLTCAHVVAKALGTQRGGPRPDGVLSLRFATSMDRQEHTGQVHEQGWVPVAADQTGDLAVLRLNRAAPVEPATLDHCGPPSPRSVKAFGHPAGDLVGRWAHAVVSGTAGPTGEWVQLYDPHTTGHRIEPGYSGAGVVDVDTGRVIGIVVGSDTQASVKGAWMMSMEAVVARLALVAPFMTAEPGQPSPSPLDPARWEHEQDLVGLLSALDGIDSFAHRNDLVSAVERMLGEQFRFPRSDRTRTDLHNLVIACLDHPRGGVLDLLVQAVRLLHDDTPGVQRLALVAALDPGRRLTADEVRRLTALLGDLPADLVRAAADTAFGEVGQPHDLDPRDDGALVRALSQMTGLPGQAPPLLRFLLRLADGSGEPAGRALREWVGVLTRRWQIPPEELILRDSVPVLRPRNSYLVVELREDGPRPDLFLLSIWLQHDTGAGFALLVRDEQPLTLDEIVGHVGEHLRRVDERQVGPVGTLMIEFVLPFSVLSQPVDQFQVVVKGRRRRLGAAFPVVVRSLDRMTNDPLGDRWRKRWTWLTGHQHQHHPHAMRWVRPQRIGIGGLEDELRRGATDYSEEVPACLMLAVRIRGAAAPEAVQEAVNLGMPVLLWCRDPGLMEQFVVDMANRLSTLTVAHIPDAVRLMRSEAEAPARPSSASQLGSHICLLWDDMDRLPPNRDLRPPSVKGPRR